MDNSQDPTVTVSAQDKLAVVKFWHAVGSLYLWEFFTTLDFEWRVIRRRLPYRWTILIYSFARVSTLVGVVLCLATMDVGTPVNCQPLVLISIIFICLSATAASLLIVLRTIAIWNRNKVVVAVAITVWCTNIAFHLHIKHGLVTDVTRLRAAWDPTQFTCVYVKADSSVLSYLPTVIADSVLLLIILAGLFILRHRGGGMFGLTRLLWKQGVIWLVLGTAVVVPPVVLTTLHSSVQLRSMFEGPSMIILTIATTRMHRSLVNFVSGSSDGVHENPKMSSLVFSKAKPRDTGTSAAVVEVAVHSTFEPHPTGPVSDDDSSTIIDMSEKTPEIMSDPSNASKPLSKPNFNRESSESCSPPTVSPSPIPRAQIESV